MSAAGALIEMTTESGGATSPDGQQHFAMLATEPVAISFDEGVTRSADQIGHLEGWPAHLVVEWQRVERTGRRAEMPLREM
jgi:hypothetical protein